MSMLLCNSRSDIPTSVQDKILVLSAHDTWEPGVEGYRCIPEKYKISHFPQLPGAKSTLL